MDNKVTFLDSVRFKDIQINISEVIKAAKYDTVLGELTITFKDDSQYAYSGVPEELINEWLNADSKGSFFHRMIKAKFTVRKLTP